MKIQLNLPEDINQAVKVYKEFYKFKTMKEAVNNILFEALLVENVTKDILKDKQLNNLVHVGTITNPAVHAYHDWFSLGLLASYRYKTGSEFDKITRHERDFLNNSTKDEIIEAYAGYIEKELREIL